MAESSPCRRVARFGVFDLDARTGELHKRGLRIRLQEQPVRVLTLLLQHAGDLVTREELQRQLWPDSVFVDFDQGLNKAILKIRVALGDSAESPRFVETIGRRGYRFIAGVEWVGGAVEAWRTSPASALPVVVRLTRADRTFSLGEGTHVVGRDLTASVWIHASVVSRRHASIAVLGERLVTVEDLGSRNGTWVNGARVTGVVPLRDGDELGIGSITLSVHISSGNTVTEPAADG